MNFPRKITIVCHEASLTGAPILLLHLLKMIKETHSITFLIIIIRDGPLSVEFSSIGKTIILKNKNYGKEKYAYKRLVPLIRSRILLTSAFIKSINCDLILSNTITTGSVISILNILNKPTAVYVHELVSVLKFPNPEKHISPLVNNRFLYLYPSKAVKLFLETELNLSASKMLQLDYYMPDTDISSVELTKNSAQLENTNKTIRVCGMGVASQRKGTDIFIKAAFLATIKNPNIKFQWIGGFETYEQKQSYKQMVLELKLDTAFHFTGQLTPNKAQQELSKNDVLFLSSREDPYPLVVLEAAKFSIPAIVFAEGGGITDFVNTKNGWVVEGISDESAASTLINLDINAIKEKGKQAENDYRRKHADKKNIMKQFESIFDAL